VKRLARRLMVGLAVLGCASPVAAVLRLQPEGSSIDLVLIGFAVFQTNLTDDFDGLFQSRDEFPAEFTNRQILNLRIDGALAETTDLEARVHHDRENLRSWRYLVRLSGERSSIAAGELDGAFPETHFTRYDTPFYGVQGNVGVGGLNVSGFGTTRRGNFRVDRLRGTNLSGPYILTASPILEGSERVAIEVRDRHDEERILRSDAQIRDRDYRLDQFSGTLQFNRPIESETFDGDPVVIFVEYQFVPRDGSKTEYLSGGRLDYELTDGVNIGSTFLKATGDASDALSDEGIIGIDQHVRLGEWFSLDNEMAGPGARFLDDREGAWLLGMEIRPHERWSVRGHFRRVGADYVTIANPRLDSELDREEWQVDMSFLPSPEHRFVGGYSEKSDDVADDPDVDRTRTRTLFAGWEGRPHGWPMLRARYEKRLTDGPATFGGGSTSLDSMTLDFEDSVGRLPVLGLSSVRGQYRFEHEEQSIGTAATSRSNSVRVRLESSPLDELDTFVETRWNWVRDVESGATASSAVRELMVVARYRLADALYGAASLRLRRQEDGAAPERSSRRDTAIFDLRWEPSERLRGLLKYEWTLNASTGDRQRDRNIYGQVAVMPWSDVTLSLGYQLDDRDDLLGDLEGNNDGEYFAAVLWRWQENSTLFARAERGFNEERLPPFEPTRSRRDKLVLGASYDVTERWTVLGQFKDEDVTGGIEAFRRVIAFEVSRSLGNMLRLGAGVELAIDEQGEADRFEGERFYLKLIGRL